ncbi:hypothetical protein UMM65_17200 [Aureibaculum sp. 2210JD6-5]|uniref:hypothetical protein n=1 Tax=Aureibaculum sp. 2210JD6-5 TaxID=3103957 RepID=UPI002AACEF95|nr:hypothetical protein [Aureibaculum sp. 2210JD6-5]MDY7396985.1 hypothetical protein [Aureibaculum sp. 2210JD6-5]
MDYEQKGKVYEYFIRKVFNCERGRRKGAERTLMIKLFLNEVTPVDKKERVPRAWQFQKVKRYIHAAVSKCRKKKTFLRSHHQFDELLVKLADSTTPNQLMEVVSLSLKKIQVLEKEYREYREQKKVAEYPKYKNRSA